MSGSRYQRGRVGMPGAGVQEGGWVCQGGIYP